LCGIGGGPDISLSGPPLGGDFVGGDARPDGRAGAGCFCCISAGGCLNGGLVPATFPGCGALPIAALSGNGGALSCAGGALKLTSSVPAVCNVDGNCMAGGALKAGEAIFPSFPSDISDLGGAFLVGGACVDPNISFGGDAATAMKFALISAGGCLNGGFTPTGLACCAKACCWLSNSFGGCLCSACRAGGDLNGAAVAGDLHGTARSGSIVSRAAKSAAFASG